MATNTYVALDKVTVGTATPSITFTSIPSGYTDLVIVANCGSASGQAFLMRFNGDTGSNYSETALLGNGSSASSYRDANVTFSEIGGIWNSQGVTIINIMNYANTTTYKTSLTRNNDAAQKTQATVNLWRSTAAITSVTLFPNSSVNFNVGSTFSLYGIAATSVGAKATGGIISSDANYYYHTFLSSGTFTPTQSLTADYLVVAGGGGGGGELGGGGGAGGMRCTVTATGGGGTLESALSLTATNYTVTIGAGGAGGVAGVSGGLGSNGSNSVFSTITSTGGGAGSRNSSSTTGGSGGGAGEAQSAGSGTANQGYAGGASPGGSPGYGAGGGGGAGAIGTAGTTTSGGNGGTGVATIINGTSTYYAGGGGGGVYTASAAYPSGTGGLGGGGDAGSYATGVDAPGNPGTANTGGGGGGAVRGDNSSPYSSGGAGGSGIVVIRYAK